MEYVVHIACLFCIFSLSALAMNLMVGYAGIVFVGAAAFMGLGAYVSALLSVRMGMSVPVAMILSSLCCAFCGCAVSLALCKLQKDYLALATLGGGLILYDVFNNWTWFTNGPMGIPGLPPVATTTTANLISLIVVVTITTAILAMIEKSQFGSLLRAIRDDEELVHSIGQSTLWPRIVVFGASFLLLGLAGAWLGHYLTFIDPTSFGLGDSIAILSMVIVGGSESYIGAILGAGTFVLLPEALRVIGLSADVASQMRQLLFGVMLVLLMIFRPQGIVGKYRVQ